MLYQCLHEFATGQRDYYESSSGARDDDVGDVGDVFAVAFVV